MTVEKTLAKIDDDLAAGRLPMARQRLRGLVSSFPADLTLRVRLAGVYRQFGEPAQAGRWGYLDAGRHPGETAAFEAHYRTPADRMRALAWHGPESAAGTAFARAELAAVRAAASESLGREVVWDRADPVLEEPPNPPSVTGDGLFIGGCVAVVLAVVALACVGIGTLIAWW
ncbi:DUF6584 family protein [Streptomyces sp. NPDC051569]|uniref:DUF6584 family protein n=1 Tax=Streptomyces sp. NPDC051569 TaxID=3365661 RepID=UPI0037B3710E